MRIRMILAAMLIAVTASACTQNGSGYGTKQTVGTLGGAALGGWAGSTIGGGTGQLAATAAGAVLGGLLGSEIGRSMDELDQVKAERAYGRATTAPVGETISWNNPDSGNYGTVTPVRDGRQTTSGRYCREFQQTVVIGGQRENAYGVACQQPDGTWEVQ